MSKSLANFISYILHPGLMPTYLLATLYFFAPYTVTIEGYSVFSRLLLLLFVFLYSFLFPTLIIWWLYKRGTIGSMKLENLADRRLPYLITITSLGFLTYFFYTKSILLKPTSVVLAFVLVTLIFVALVSLKWQISAHSAAIGGVLGALFILKFRFDENALYWPFFCALFLAGLIGSARLKLNAHTPLQVIAGLTIGLIIGIIGSLYI